MREYLEEILRAQVYDVAIETPLERATHLSKRLSSEVLLKREDLQPQFSFKVRGAYNKIAQLDDTELSRGVICASAGNHAQGVALAAKRKGIRAVIVMPITTPSIKTQAVEALGGEVVLEGDSFDSACSAAVSMAERDGMTFIHPFDDPAVIAGQGTIGMELMRQHRSVDAIFVPVGGGGLISGIALYVKALFPEVKIIGVEPKESASMYTALKQGSPTTLEHVGIFADGVAVRRVGDETFRICNDLVDDILLVSTDEICAAIQDIFEDTRTVMEPAGGLAVAGIKKYVETKAEEGKTFVAINCGANVNFDRLRHIAERAAIGEHREALLAVEIPEEPGSFLQFCGAIGKRNVTEFNYRFGQGPQAKIFVGVELTKGTQERAEIIEALEGAGYPVLDMSDDEMAKLHIRHMVGGRAPGLENERLYRFEFPERPGALANFLCSVGSQWNISLFHYRNHGSDYGRVLAGVQVPDHEVSELSAHFAELGYRFWDETDNPAYKLFLAS